MTTKQPVPKSKIALAAALAVAVLGYGSYVAYDSMSTKIPAPALQESTSTTLNSMDTLNQPVPEPVVSRQAVFVPSPAASEIISFEKQASVQTARFNALTAQKMPMKPRTN